MNKKAEENNWTTVDSTPKYDNPWINVTEYQVINPSGGRGIYGLVSFKNIAVGVVPLDEAHNTWLVGQYRYPLKEYSWEIPEGGCLKGKESVLEAAQRELKEETGLIAVAWKEVGKIHTSNSVTDEVGYILVAQDLSLTAAEPEETEDLQVRKVPLKEAVEMCMCGEITDSLSLFALLKVNMLIERGEL